MGMMNKLKVAFIVTLIGIALTVAAAVAYLTGCGDWASGLSIASTGISIALGFFSIIYTYISGQKTLDNLNEIEVQYNSLVNKINLELSASNTDDANAENVRHKVEERGRS